MSKHVAVIVGCLVATLFWLSPALAAEQHDFDCSAPPKWLSGNSPDPCGGVYTVGPGQEFAVRQDVATDSAGDIALARYEAYTEGDEQLIGRKSLQGRQSGVLWRNGGGQPIKLVIKVIISTIVRSGTLRGAFLIR